MGRPFELKPRLRAAMVEYFGESCKCDRQLRRLHGEYKKTLAEYGRERSKQINMLYMVKHVTQAEHGTDIDILPIIKQVTDFERDVRTAVRFNPDKFEEAMSLSPLHGVFPNFEEFAKRRFTMEEDLKNLKLESDRIRQKYENAKELYEKIFIEKDEAYKIWKGNEE